MEIRKAKKENVEELLNLYLELIKHNLKFAKFVGNKNSQINKKELKNSIKKLISKKKSLLLIASDKYLLGFIYGKIMSSKESRTDKKVAEVVDIYIHSKRKGIGKKLLKEFEKWARKEGAKFILWEFIAGNQIATDFCLKNKFKHFKVKMLKKIN